MKPSKEDRISYLQSHMRHLKNLGYCELLIRKGLLYCHNKCTYWEKTFCSKGEKWEGFLEVKSPIDKKLEFIIILIILTLFLIALPKILDLLGITVLGKR